MTGNIDIHNHPWQQKIVDLVDLAKKADPDFKAWEYILFISVEDTEEYDEIVLTGQLGFIMMHFPVWRRYALCMGYTAFWGAEKTELRKLDSLNSYEKVMVENYRRFREKYDELYKVSDYKKQREGYNIAEKECDGMASMTIKRAISQLESQGINCEAVKQIMRFYL